MNLLCTGNPTHSTVASAVSRVWPRADFASRATGYDLRFWDEGSESYFRERVKNYDVFINSSFICNNGQLCLLETTFEEWSRAGIQGHIVNIGSSAEFLGVDSVWGAYSIQKRSLRDRSLQLNGKHGIKTTHITAGGLDDGTPEKQHFLSLDCVASTIKWVLDQSYCVPLIYIEARSQKNELPRPR